MDGSSRMPLDKIAYRNLEQQFRAQVERDRAHIIERVVQNWGVYLPCKEPKNQVDYILVGMEPSFGWAKCIRDAEKKIACGFRNFSRPSNHTDPLALFMFSIERFLCQPGETYHLTDVSKGAMPVTVAALDRDRRYEEWYPLLLDEIEILGKSGAPVIAIGKKVETFLRKCKLQHRTGRSLYRVVHYSRQASRHWKAAAEGDYGGFKAFNNREFGEDRTWAADISLAKKQLVFAYKKKFEAIRANG